MASLRSYVYCLTLQLVMPFKKIVQLGPGTELTEIDVKGIFCLVPVNPLDHHLLDMEWRGGIFIDICLPFGMRSAPKLFNLIADFLQWILQEQVVKFLKLYLDNYLTLSIEAPRNVSSISFAIIL